MPKAVVIVESPAKAKTIEAYLGKGYRVLASFGHVRDLLAKTGAVDVDHDFAMKYVAVERNKRHVDAIAKALKSADQLILATDPDREGEAIAWHVRELMQAKKDLAGKPVSRVVFHQITKAAVQEAMANPRELAMDLVNAQQARRALDYLVGFTLSPLLWKKVRRGLSAGRVQSPALRMIVERELEIEKFKSQEYWTTHAHVAKEKSAFEAKLTVYQGEKLKQFSIVDEAQAAKVKDHLLEQAQGQLRVHQVEKKQRKRNPAPPFTTSTLQQEAARKLGFTASRTMRTAQGLYEGVQIGMEQVGLITYMRTDSVHLAQEAVDEMRGYVAKHYGDDYLPKQARQFKTKAKNAQEAHEAIRPTHCGRTPESLKSYLSDEQFKLYQLVWKRALASQMQHALLDTVGIDLVCGTSNIFRATGSTIKHPGFMAVYLEGQDDIKGSDLDEKTLPALKEGDVVDLKDILSEQHFTEPPPRYTEASLVKALEEHGIGRPSTYASIISTLQQREYVVLEKKRFEPTDVGRVVNRFLTQYFERYVDYDFTANLEDELDAVARGEMKWKPLLSTFWTAFKARIDDIEVSVDRQDVTQEKLDEDCPECGKPLSVRLGRRGQFVGCTGYPECKYTRNMDGEQTGSSEPEVVEGRACPKCESPLVQRHGRFGPFVGCSAYPDCKFIESNRPEPKSTEVTCPECKKGKLLERVSRRGKPFYSCEHYPKCKYAVWDQPVDEACPECSWPIVTLKTTKTRGTEKICPQKECAYKETVSPPDKKG